jgi:hypothetical protein
MEFVFEVLLQFFGEILLQLIVQVLAELGLHSLGDTFQRRKHPIWSMIGFTLWGAIAGGLSLLIFPQFGDCEARVPDAERLRYAPRRGCGHGSNRPDQASARSDFGSDGPLRLRFHFRLLDGVCQVSMGDMIAAPIRGQRS